VHTLPVAGQRTSSPSPVPRWQGCHTEVVTDLPRGLCHYTSGQGLLGILQNREVWSTHISYLNDHTESRLAFDMARSLLERIFALRALSGRAPELCARLLGDMVPERADPGMARYVTSFTEQWDDLSQWRGYTTPGDGYSVAFDAEVLESAARARGWRLEMCLYGGLAEARITPLLMQVFNDHLAGRWSADADPLDSAVTWLNGRLVDLAPLVKHDAFSAEQEWRLISPPMPDFSSDVQFRVGRSFLVPYLPFQYSRPGEPSVMHVNVGPGPNAELALRSVLRVLSLSGHRCGAGVASAPYRPW
jgi:hypothetical protein